MRRAESEGFAFSKLPCREDGHFEEKDCIASVKLDFNSDRF